MEIKSNFSIEQYDRLRYQTIKWFTIGWAAWFGIAMVNRYIGNNTVKALFAMIGIMGLITWVINFIKLRRLDKKIKSDSNLYKALNNELVVHNKYKASRVGFIVTISVVGVCYGITLNYPLPALNVCEVTLFTGVLSGLIASLFYNREPRDGGE